MSLTHDEFLEISVEASHRLNRELNNAFRFGELKEYLSRINMLDLYPMENTDYYETNPKGKILIIGDSNVKEREIYGIGKKLGLEKARFELELGYNENKNYEYKKLRYNTDYRLILVGPLPHKTIGNEGYSSVITMLEQESYYPKVVRLTNSNELKITKTNLKEALTKEIESGFLKS